MIVILTIFLYISARLKLSEAMMTLFLACDSVLMAILVYIPLIRHFTSRDPNPQPKRRRLSSGSYIIRERVFLHKRVDEGDHSLLYLAFTVPLFNLLVGMIADISFMTVHWVLYWIIIGIFYLFIGSMIFIPQWQHRRQDGLIFEIRPAELVDEFSYHSGYRLSLRRLVDYSILILDIPYLEASMIEIDHIYAKRDTSFARMNRKFSPEVLQIALHEYQLIQDKNDLFASQQLNRLILFSASTNELQKYRNFLLEWLDPLYTQKMIIS